MDDVAEKIGDGLVAKIDRFPEARRVAFATTEYDRGDGVKGKYVDTIVEALNRHNIRAAFMPFALNGRLVYEVTIVSKRK